MSKVLKLQMMTTTTQDLSYVALSITSCDSNSCNIRDL